MTELTIDAKTFSSRRNNFIYCDFFHPTHIVRYRKRTFIEIGFISANPIGHRLSRVNARPGRRGFESLQKSHHSNSLRRGREGKCKGKFAFRVVNMLNGISIDCCREVREKWFSSPTCSPFLKCI